MAPRSRRSKATQEEESLPPRKLFDIPYFAHQRLDPDQFPDNVGLPVGGPLTEDTPVAKPDSAKDGHESGDPSDDSFFNAIEGSEDEYTTNVDVSKGKRTAIVPLDGKAYKRLKVTGGRPAFAKKITADMDSDDELIFSMKNAKYLERDIAKRLADEGRMNYNPKSIGTRWARLKKAMQAKQDELLDADLTDWHDGDDDCLHEAVAKADEAVEKMKKAADDRKWRMVADNLKVLKPVTNFSKNACERRFEALRNGTAKPTPESEMCPSAATQARMDARREREQKIEEDKQKAEENSENLKGNAWTSRQRQHFD